MTYPAINEEFVALQETPDIPENMVYTTIDKFQVLQGPATLPPYKCASCGNEIMTKEQWFVDWLFQLDFYGQVLFCTDCVRQMANQLGYMDPQQVRQLVEAKSKLIQQVSQLINENTELRNALAAIGIVTADSEFVKRDVAPGKTRSQESRAEQRRDLPVEPKVFSRDERTVVEAEPKPVRQNTSKRPAKLSGDDTLDQLLGESI